MIRVSSDLGHFEISAEPIPADGDVDIAALPLKEDITVRFPLEPTTEGMGLSQQIYFLGYPFGLQTLDKRGMTVPFIKSGIISAMDSSNPDRHILYLDAHNNPGFSGGPIVFWHQASKLDSGKFSERPESIFRHGRAPLRSAGRIAPPQDRSIRPRAREGARSCGADA